MEYQKLSFKLMSTYCVHHILKNMTYSYLSVSINVAKCVKNQSFQFACCKNIQKEKEPIVIFVHTVFTCINVLSNHDLL